MAMPQRSIEPEIVSIDRDTTIYLDLHAPRFVRFLLLLNEIPFNWHPPKPFPPLVGDSLNS